ncbi:hypothetical protein ACFQWB_14060 [Paenibacillus thermoaerophilus]|uniref:Uncharacterized protein n=1 Tax=Paenibacillus thermoaerophilus TaxID=1215385 RepID=A0ABW2V744_9BACL|nr:hypothetical protein [Paenibacillus thermoaerophilus]TMV15926.1 hypothetical protein FE781_10090 [Paenibacillus thermoaerophilus]
MSKGKVKFKKASNTDRHRHTMRIVSSDVCRLCKQQCARGIAYMNRMEEPGAVGYGVPCILTKGRAPK